VVVLVVARSMANQERQEGIAILAIVWRTLVFWRTVVDGGHMGAMYQQRPPERAVAVAAVGVMAVAPLVGKPIQARGTWAGLVLLMVQAAVAALVVLAHPAQGLRFILQVPVALAEHRHSAMACRHTMQAVAAVPAEKLPLALSQRVPAATAAAAVVAIQAPERMAQHRLVAVVVAVVTERLLLRVMPAAWAAPAS
jgi:hypothetical protein